MKCKIIFDIETIPTFEDFEKANEYEGYSCNDIINKLCQNQTSLNLHGFILTPDNLCYKFHYWKPSIVIENSLQSNLTYSFVNKLESKKQTMKCNVIKSKNNINLIPKFEDFFDEYNSACLTIRHFVEFYFYDTEDGWILEDHKLYKVSSGHRCIFVGELYPSNSPLTFETLRKANIRRLPEFKNSKGEPAHSKPDGSDWSPEKPLIEKELADVQIYFDILAFRVGVDLAKATENKFNEVSERIGCNLRIENNEVVRKETETYAKKYPIYYTTSPQPQPIDFAKLGSGELTSFSINDRKSYVSPTKKELHSGTITNIKVQTTNSVINENVTLSISENDEIKISVNSFRQELFVRKSFSSDIGGALNEMVRWKLFRNYAEIYPLKISRSTIEDIFSFEFQGIDNNKQYLFYHAKRVFHAYRNMSLIQRYVQQSYLFEYFSKQLGTKIIGMLINGSKENTKLNPGDLIQFHDDRNVLYNFRLVKSSDKNVEVSNT